MQRGVESWLQEREEEVQEVDGVRVFGARVSLLSRAVTTSKNTYSILQRACEHTNRITYKKRYDDVPIYHYSPTFAETNSPQPRQNTPAWLGGNGTHPLREHYPQHKQRQQSCGSQPPVQHERSNPVQPLLVLPLSLRVVCHERLQWPCRRIWIR